MGLIQEFKEFAMKGNALDMAVGIILGAGFNKIVQSLVNDMLMPPIGMLIGGVDFKDLKVMLKVAEGEKPAVTMNAGLFVNSVIDFMIVAFTVFLVVKVMNRMATRAGGLLKKPA